ncbi:MAG TPA: hypothetical protein VF937_03540, partial [Chloroflexota bacterium]
MPLRRALALVGVALIGLATLPLAVYGVAQLGETTMAQLRGPAQVTDFVAIYSGARIVLSEPGKLYAPGVVPEMDRSLTGGDRFDRPFSFVPSAALLLAPLAALPYGLAYLIWLGASTAALALATYCLAPRARLWP